MRDHFRYLHFKTFPTTPRTPQCEVFCPLLSSSEHSGVSEDSNSQLFQVLGFTPTLGQSKGATRRNFRCSTKIASTTELTLSPYPSKFYLSVIYRSLDLFPKTILLKHSLTLTEDCQITPSLLRSYHRIRFPSVKNLAASHPRCC
jgi:hypothetical protein